MIYNYIMDCWEDSFEELKASEFITDEADSKEEAEDISSFKTLQNKCFEMTREVILFR